MWYCAVGLSELGDTYKPLVKNLHAGPVCYAESTDGINWTKPNLGQLEIHGSKGNNAIAPPDSQIEGVHVMLDEDDPDPARHYKMVYNPHIGKTWVIHTTTRPDGIHWKAADDFGIDQFLETAWVSRFHDLFVVNGQRITFSDGGYFSGRQGRAIISTDFSTTGCQVIPAHSCSMNQPTRNTADTPSLTIRFTWVSELRDLALLWAAFTASGTICPGVRIRRNAGAGSAKARFPAILAWSSAMTACIFVSRSRSRPTFYA